MSFLNYLLEKLSNVLLLQTNCSLCGIPNQSLICMDCLYSLPTIDHQHVCKCCLQPKLALQVCNNCLENEFLFTKIIAAYKYADPTKQLLHLLKYNAKLDYSKLISQLFYTQIIAQIDALPDVIIPIPLHHTKQLARGFNQSHELLRCFNEINPDIPILHIIRSKQTKSQAMLNKEARQNNLTNSFIIPYDLSNLNVVIVDDVVTTGVTVNELTRTCLQQGANSVEVWCFLRP